MLKRSIDIKHYEHFKVLTVLNWFASEYSSRSCSKMCTMRVVLESLLSVPVIAIYFDYLSNHSIFKSPGVGRGGGYWLCHGGLFNTLKPLQFVKGHVPRGVTITFTWSPLRLYNISMISLHWQFIGSKFSIAALSLLSWRRLIPSYILLQNRVILSQNPPPLPPPHPQ